jgi:5,10-methylenetetrahydromethanopterin reductase
MNAIGEGERKPARPRTAVKETIAIVDAMLQGKAVDFEGKEFRAQAPAMSAEADASRDRVPIYVAATGPRLQELAGEVADGMLTAGLTTPDFLRWTYENVARGASAAGRDPSGIDIGSTLIASIHETDRDLALDGAREIAGMYLSNKIRNIKGTAETLLELADISREEIEPIAEALDRGGRRAAAELVTDDLLRRCKPIAGTPSDCIEAIEEYHAAGCSHIMLELWGDQRSQQLQVFGKHVLPHFHRHRAD